MHTTRPAALFHLQLPSSAIPSQMSVVCCVLCVACCVLCAVCCVLSVCVLWCVMCLVCSVLCLLSFVLCVACVLSPHNFRIHSTVRHSDIMYLTPPRVLVSAYGFALVHCGIAPLELCTLAEIIGGTQHGRVEQVLFQSIPSI
jgi:hypothetical protein